MIHIILIIVSFLFPPGDGNHGPGIGFTENDFYIISIGNNHYPEPYWKILYAESDARKIAGLVQKSIPKEEVYDSRNKSLFKRGKVKEFILTGDQVTNENIRKAFQHVVDSSKSRDYFFFYFGGLSTVEENERGKRHYLVGYNDSLGGFGKLNYDQIEAISIKELNGYLENMQAKNQAIILEAGQTAEVSDELVSSIADTDPLSMILMQRNRVVISPKSFGIDLPEYGSGLLTKIFSDLVDNSTFDTELFHFLYNEHWEEQFYFDLFKVEEALAEKVDFFYESTESWIRNYQKFKSPRFSSYLDIFFERNLVRYLNAFKSQFLTQTRGVGTLSSESESNEKSNSGITRHALLIGINEYDSNSWPDLKNPIYDIKAVEEELRTVYGFQTDTLLNPTQNEIMSKLYSYSQEVTYGENSQFFVFIAGHGGYDKFTPGFIAARDSKSRQEDPTRSSYIRHSTLRDVLNNIPSKQLFVVLDVCYGGTFDQRLSEATYRSEQDDPLYQNVDKNIFIDRKMEHKSRLYMTSGGKEWVPEGRPGKHSPFASRFLEALRSYGGNDGVLTFSEIKQYVDKITPEPMAGPFGNNEPGSDFIFVSGN